MKAKSRLRSKLDNDTQEKMSEDSRSNIEMEINNKVSESFDELKITDEMLQKFFSASSCREEVNNNPSIFAVRYQLPPDKQQPNTKKICVLKRAPANVAAVPSSTLFEQTSLRMDGLQRPVQHSILGSLEDFFKMSLGKKRLTMQEIPVEFHTALGQNVARRPVTSMLPVQRDQQRKEALISARKIDTPVDLCDPDTRALKLWEKRMMERRDLQTHISKKVQRLPENLIFNSGEGYRKKQEENEIISKSIPYYGGGYGYRTGNEFWKQNEVIFSNTGGELHMSNTLAEKGYPPPIVHVGVSDRIKIEKGTPSIKPRPNMGYSGYEMNRHNELKQIISELDPHPPQISDLVIAGSQLQRSGNVFQSSEDLNNLSENDIGFKKDSFSSEVLTRPNTDESNDNIFSLPVGPSLLINSISLNSSFNGAVRSPLEIRVLFNDYTRNRCLEKIHFHNTGSSIIRFWWKKLESFDPFQLENKDVRRFYFDTQDGILLPNEQLYFPLIFKSDKSGIFSERWKLETLPTLTLGQDIIIYLKGVALQRDTLAITRRKIETYLNYRIADDIARGILDDILQSMYFKLGEQTSEEEPLYSEKDIFNLKNEGINYDVDSVKSLMKIHKELTVKEENLDEEWSMSCQQLRHDIYNKDAIKTVKKEEAYTKFYKHLDKMMFPTIKSNIVRKDLLYRIGYRSLLDFSGDMFVALADLRKSHDLPDMELRLAREKRISNLSRQRTNNSQSSKTSVKKQIEARTSISANRSKSKEPSVILREPTEVMLNDIDEIDKFGSRSASDMDELTDNEPRQSLSTNPNLLKYHAKSLQMVYSLLDDAITNIVNYWDDVSQQ